MDENLIKNIYDYLSKAFAGTKPIWGAILGFAGSILFPVPFYQASFIAVMVAAGLDAFSKLYAIGKKNGGLKRSVLFKKLLSKAFWKGTEVKIVSYLTVAVLTGLSYRVVYLEQMGIFIASFAYSVMFMREFQSIVENLVEAGADLDWLLLFTKKKNKELMQPYEKEKETPKKDEVNDYEPRI